MIDAYEIGIELALQDGVSAGLDAVSKEMAALDAALAASSAGLAALTRTAHTAAAAATAAVGGAQAKAVEPRAADVMQNVEQGQGGQGQRAAPGVAVVEIAAAPAAAGGDWVQEAVKEMQPASSIAGEPARESVRLVDAPSAAPVPEQNPEQARRGPEGGQAGTRPVIVSPQVALPGAAPIERAVAASAPRAAVIAEAAPQEIVADLTGTGRDLDTPARVTAPARPGEVRADVASATPFGATAPDVPPRAGQNAAAVQVVPSRLVAGVPVERERVPSAPMAGLFAENAAAPQTESDGRGDGGGGTVVLDGRLVGHWLSERMARDAARPAAGPTFFDPRQAPAWTPSGAA